MMIKNRMVRLGAGLLVMALTGAALSGCSGSHREKIVLPGNAESGEEIERRDGARDRESAEIVIVLEPSLPETVSEQTDIRNGAGAENETDNETGVWADDEAGAGLNEEAGTGMDNETSESISSRRKTSADYEAGQILTAGEVKELGTNTFFYQTTIGTSLYQRMDGKSYKSGCPVAVEDLRYLRVLHWGYQGEIRVGELVCNQSISEDLLSIFRKLYDAHYPIEKIRLIDDYGGDDDLSSSDNNTSCFNYRNVAGTEYLSRHALGIAIDINPVCNPYVVTDEEGNVTCAPANGSRYMDRSQSFSHKIDEEDLCCRLFTEAGFTWGGSWQDGPDYMHFSKGSTPET